MQSYIRCLLVSILLTLIIPASAQYFHKGDYIVTTNKDTVFGDVQASTWGGLVKVRSRQTLITYNEDEVDTWYSGKQNAVFKRRKLPHRLAAFVQCAEFGKINVYVQGSSLSTAPQYNGTGFTPGSSYGTSAFVYLEKEPGILIEILKPRSFGKDKFSDEAFLALVNDIPEIKNIYLETGKHDATDICYYIHEYNIRAGGIRQ